MEDAMPKSKTVSSSKKVASVRHQYARDGSRIIQHAEIYPMMPRGYTAAERAELRKFERELLKGRTIKIR